MSHERSQNHAEDRDHEHDPLCVECGQLLTAFLGSRLSRDADPRFRELLRGCSECRVAYREAVTRTASLARSLRETKERQAIRRDDRRRKRQRVKNATAGISARQRRFYLQLMVVPALLLWALNRLDQESPVEIVASIAWNGGGVDAAGALLDEDQPERELAVGDVVVLKPGARATITDEGAVLELEGANHWLVEPDGSRYRLFRGRARVDASGETSLVTARGVVTLEAGTRATVSAGDGPLQVSCEGGRVHVASATAEVTLNAGESFPPARR